MTVLRCCPTLWRIDTDGPRSYVLMVDGDKSLTLLNPVASIIYCACDGTQSEEDIARLLLDRYPNVPEASIRADLKTFVEGLVERGVLLREESAS